MENKESKIKINWMTIDAEKEIKYSLRPELIRQNCSFGSRSVNVQFDINLPLLLLQEEDKHLSVHSVTPS